MVRKTATPKKQATTPAERKPGRPRKSDATSYRNGTGYPVTLDPRPTTPVIAEPHQRSTAKPAKKIPTLKQALGELKHTKEALRLSGIANKEVRDEIEKLQDAYADLNSLVNRYHRFYIALVKLRSGIFRRRTGQQHADAAEFDAGLGAKWRYVKKQ